MNRLFSTVIHCLIILSVGIVIYLPALSASFHLDDSPSIRDNAAIRHLHDIKVIWEFWPTRFFNYLSLAVNFHYSQLAPRPYHAVNIGIHLANALLVYALCRRLSGSSGFIPLAASLVFLCHPLQTQAVTYVVQRATSLASLFYLLSVWLYLKSRQVEAGDMERETCNVERVTCNEERGTGSGEATASAEPSLKQSDPPSDAIRQAKRSGISWVYYILSFLACLVAMLTKEFTITLPLIILVAELLVNRDSPVSARTRVARLLPFLLAVFLIPLLVFFHRGYPCYNDSGQIEWAKQAGIVDTVAEGHGGSPREYLLTQPRVLMTYLRLIVFPLRQRVEYDYPKIFSPFRIDFVVPLIVMFSLVLISLAAVRRKYFMAAFGILWFFITLIPESSVIPILDLAVEHRLYLPLAGAAFLVVPFLTSLSRFRKTASALLILVLMLFCALTGARNLVWRSPVTLWEDNVAKAEGKARVHGNLGKAYLDAGRFERAAAEFKRMIEIDPTFTGAYNNLAVIYIDHLKDYEEAKKYIAASLSLFPDYPAGYLNLGVIYLNNRELKAAIENFNKALELDPKSLLAHYNLAACYINLGNLDRAEEYLRRGLEYWPEEGRFYALLARIYKERGDERKAEEYFRKARSLNASAP